MTAESLFLLLVLPAASVHAGLWGVLALNLAYLRRQPSPSADSRPSLSVCIPARNEADNLRRLLPTLKNQNYPDLEILVWDDGSEDDTWEVLSTAESSRLTPLRGTDPPDGWVGKVHALYQCTREASGACYLFLDADAELRRPDALRQLVARHRSSRTQVSSGFPRLRGAVLLLVSLVPHALLSSLPWPLVPRTQLPALSALNGQCWLVDRDVYHRHEPHAQVKNAVLEDVAIGRYLKRQGHAPTLLDVQDLVSIHMYDGFGEAWRGFRKNAYLLLGGTPSRFAVMYGGFLLSWLVAPLLSVWFLVSLYGLKAVTDRASGMPLYITVLAPLSYLLGLMLQIDSAVHHWNDRVRWKGRSVPSSARDEASPAPMNR
ncbi:glycosyltransferase [Salinibacter altiplanensis]|uniref:glycosyltransferase n=1 Tax=Salinibacter altiplanensis TaxID=1803181 RepID=UPI000C9F3197|nr:glycosyltransferase family 2 protein [Salinibacter altiplanensis]